MPLFGSLRGSGHQEGGAFLLFLKDAPTVPANDTSVVSVTPAPQRSASTASSPTVSVLSPMVRSMVLPGWGQYANGQSWKGGLFFGSSLLLFGQAVRARSAFDEQQANYNDPLAALAFMQTSGGTALNVMYQAQQWRELERTRDASNLSVALLGAFWAYNIYDASVATPEGDYQVRVFPGLGSFNNIEEGKINFSVEVSLP